jgi:hypothetical protein
MGLNIAYIPDLVSLKKLNAEEICKKYWKTETFIGKSDSIAYIHLCLERCNKNKLK